MFYLMCSDLLDVLQLPDWSGRAHNRNTTKDRTIRRGRALLARYLLLSQWMAPSHLTPTPSPAGTPLPAAAWMSRYRSHWKPCERPTEYMVFYVFLNSYLVYDHTESERS